MKRIVVPTDFSNNANNALHYAIHLANQFKAKIHLINVFEVRSNTGTFNAARDFIRNEAEENLASTIKKYKSYLHQGTSIEGKAIEGQTIDTLCFFAKSRYADLIVMGTQGASGLSEVFLGTNTAGVIKKSKTPVLAIPNGYRYEPIKNITFSVDSNIVTNSDVVDPLVQIAKKYNSVINVLHIEKVKTIAGVDAGIDVFLSDIPHVFHLVNDNNIHRGITKFNHKTRTNLLCMIKRNRGVFGNLFHSSVTLKEAFHSTIPLLTLYDF